MLNEAKTSRPRPRPQQRGRGQCLEVVAKAEAKISVKKYQIMIIATYDLRLLLEKLTNFPNFTRFLPEKCMPDYIIRQQDRGRAETKSLKPKPRPKFWPRGDFCLEDLTSLNATITACDRSSDGQTYIQTEEQNDETVIPRPSHGDAR